MASVSSDSYPNSSFDYTDPESMVDLDKTATTEKLVGIISEGLPRNSDIDVGLEIYLD